MSVSVGNCPIACGPPRVYLQKLEAYDVTEFGKRSRCNPIVGNE